MTSPKTTRQTLRELRNSVSLTHRTTAASAILNTLLTLPLWKNSHNIAGYLPHDGEIDPSVIMHTCWQQQKNYYLPILHPSGESRLWFCRYQINDPLVPNRYSILEPKYQTHHLLAPHALDLVLVPLVGFDKNGNRLGMGKGYYDRTFEFLQHPFRRKPYLLGIGYEIQKVDVMVTQPWDVVLNGILTEQHLYER